jgi:hypothetical protein
MDAKVSALIFCRFDLAVILIVYTTQYYILLFSLLLILPLPPLSPQSSLLPSGRSSAICHRRRGEERRHRQRARQRRHSGAPFHNLARARPSPLISKCFLANP